MLEIQNLTRRFGEVTAVDGATFDVPGGRLTGFVGGNGAGKTTTMRMIMGLLEIHGGEISWHGCPITAADRAQFGYMPEERGLYPKQGIRSQLVYFAQLQGLSAADAGASADSLLERFNLGGRAKDKLESLSLGNQQRVQIAAAVISSPRALILDEPFSGLDPVAVDDMVQLLRELTADGVPVLFSSHQLDVVERICDRLVILSRGRVAAAGTVDELRDRGRVMHRLILTGDAGWLRDLDGVHVSDVAGHQAILEVEDPASEQRLLAEALSRSGIREYTRLRPSLADIYKEVAA